ncbi:hypothetical protein HYH03_005626 [Edaphochlamys debaryana]|uniref:Uncharacterized protein n=1 Tax=Edaphochlamys debaryana TaxID=47281 RepID=A0A835YF05_9CHLO|nr:hypothetical protein HYH03_005626 [Edaphochlamys debaryana]|eukprot:KAG2496399.1 hypothetical protein HYH03_005626 [Edaphochlamys debaryana]
MRRNSAYDHGQADHSASRVGNMAESAVLKGRAVLDQLAGALSGPRPKGVTKTKLRAAAEEELWAIAWYEGYTSGKWLVQCPEASVDEAWASIAAAVEDGQLGSAAKVATQALHGGHTACIYMERFDDIEGVRQVYETLKGLGLGPGPNSFKLDLWTVLGIYKGNAWGLPVSVFTPKTLYSEEQAERIRRACGRR